MSLNHHLHNLALAAAVVLSWVGAAGGCAGGTVETDDGTGGSSSTSTSGQGAGGQGGTTSGTAGTGGSPSPCAVDCTQIQAPQCQVAQCNAQTGQCEVVADTDGSACDDGQFCTVEDACVAGVCASGPDNDCGITASACEAVSCDENSQSCSTIPSQNGDPCVDPNDQCQEGATCMNGQCLGGVPKDCFFQPVPDDCHVSECNPQNGQCEPVVGNEGGSCTDLNDLCTVAKTCVSGVCQGGQPMSCSHLTQGCLMGICDPNSGSCTTQMAGQGQPCDDVDFCTTGETCNNGVCGGGTPVTVCQNGDLCCPSNCNENNDQECAIPSGTARLVNGGFINVQYHLCGSGVPGQCTAAVAQTTCQQVGQKVVSHASNGTSTVASLGATASCYFSISYFTVNQVMPPGSCFVGVSNLMWSSCCNTSAWHGNTLDFGAPNQTFGRVYQNDSGYVSQNANVDGTHWGCQALTSAAQNFGSCTTQYVACTP
ncbi:MAG: hypothetical protein JRI68_08055 [Deltaproteobacteria bacterium]|nr:hypothetical protein [Deltaproteobacteria bacterium]